MKNVLGIIFRENLNTNSTFNHFVFRRSCHLWDNVENVCREGQARDENMAHAHCKVDT